MEVIDKAAFIRFLKAEGACARAMRWVEKQKYFDSKAWGRCPDGGWMAWILHHLAYKAERNIRLAYGPDDSRVEWFEDQKQLYMGLQRAFVWEGDWYKLAGGKPPKRRKDGSVIGIPKAYLKYARLNAKVVSQNIPFGTVLKLAEKCGLTWEAR